MIIALFVILGILAFLLLLLFAYLRIHISYRNQSFFLYMQIGPILYKVPLQKKPKYRSLAKQLRGKKLSAPFDKNEKKQGKKEKKNVLNELQEDLALTEFLSTLKDISIRLANRYAKKLHIKVEQLHITVGGSSPAATGIAYGVVAQSTAYLLEFLDSTVTLIPLHEDAVHVTADFSGNWDACIQAKIKIRIIHLLQALFQTFFHLKSAVDTNEQQNIKI